MDRSDFVAWHVWTDARGNILEDFFATQPSIDGFRDALEESAALARRSATEELGITRNFVQWLPSGMRPTRL